MVEIVVYRSNGIRAQVNNLIFLFFVLFPGGVGVRVRVRGYTVTSSVVARA